MIRQILLTTITKVIPAVFFTTAVVVPTYFYFTTPEVPQQPVAQQEEAGLGYTPPSKEMQEFFNYLATKDKKEEVYASPYKPL